MKAGLSIFADTMNKCVDAVFLSLLWVICSIPIITLGVSTAAFYAAVNKNLVHGRSYAAKEFFAGLKSNFKQVTPAYLIELVILVVAVIDVRISYVYRSTIQIVGYFLFFFVVLAALVCVWIIFTAGVSAKFENTWKNTMKNAFMMMSLNLPWSLMILLLTAVAAYVIYLIPLVVLFVPAVWMVCITVILERVFKKYMSEEDIAAEEERNREYYN